MNNNRTLAKTSSWTTDDLRNAAASWTLAGDKALLDILQNIHEGLHQRTEQVINKIDELNSELGNTSLSLKNVNNKFIGLNNTQFVECTVQEDDEEIIKKETDSDNKLVINTHVNTQLKDKESLESEKREKILDCVSKSLRHLEGLCERLEISPDSDSDSDSQPEDIIQRTVLKPKDLYSDEPLPHIIGSQEWKKKWHIGLYECSSDSESENEDNRESSSRKKKDSYSSYEELYDNNDPRSAAERKNQMTLPIQRVADNQPRRISSTSVPSNYSTDTEDSEVAKINSDIKPGVHSTPKQKVENSENDKQVPKSKVNASDFAAELAKKLGGGNLMSNPINTNKSQEGGQNKTSGGSKTEGHSKSNMAKQKDSKSKKGLFDSGFRSGTERGVSGNIFFDEPPPMDTESIHDDKDDLFGSNDDDNDSISGGLFSSKPSKPNPKDSGLFGNAPASKYGGLFGDIPDDDDDDIVETKKPITKHQISKGLFDDDSDEDIFTTKIEPKAVSKNDSEIKRPQTSSIKKVEKTKDLFDDDLESSIEIKTENKSKNSASVVQPTSKGLFDDSDDESDLFGGNISFASKNDAPKFSKPSQISNTKPSAKGNDGSGTKKISLFDDTSDDDGDLFSSLKPAVQSVPSKPEQKKPEFKTVIDVPKSKPHVIEKKHDNVTEEDLFSPLRMPEKKSVIETQSSADKKVTEEMEPEIEKTNTPPKKPAGAVSMFGDNINILKGPNSLAASILSRKRKESSSDESASEDELKEDAKDPKSKTTQETMSEPSRNVSNKPTSQQPVETKKIEFTKQVEISKTENVHSKQTTEVSQNRSVLDIKSGVKPSDILSSQPVKLQSDKSKQLNKEKNDLFEDSDDLFSRNIKPSSNLFEETEPLELPPPLETATQVVKEPRNSNSLFDDDEDDEDLFSSLKGSKTNKNDSTKYNTNLFDDVPEEEIFRKNSNSSNVDLFSDEPPDLDYIPDDADHEFQQNIFDESSDTKIVPPIENDDFKITSDNYKTDPSQIVDNAPLTVESKKKNSLFGDSSDDDEDLFSSLLKKKTDTKDIKKDVQEKESNSDLFPQVTKPIISQSKPKVPIKSETEIDRKSNQSMNVVPSPGDVSVRTVEEHASSEQPEVYTSNIDPNSSQIKNVEAKIDSSDPKDIKTNIKQLIGRLENNEIEEIKSDKKDPFVGKAKYETGFVKEEIDGSSFSSLSPEKGSDHKPPESPAKTINKLKTNLNINVKALMPGSTPILRKKTGVGPQPVQAPGEPTTSDTPPNSLDGVLANNWSKDKIKVQVKRRPQSRKARHEAARKSAADMLYSFDSTDSSQYINSLPNSPTQEDVSESFSSLNSEVIGSAENSISENFESTIQTIGKLYGNNELNEGQQSKGSQVLEGQSPQKHSDIFNIRSTVPAPPEIVKEISKNKEPSPDVQEGNKPKALFDDLADDIFTAPRLGKQKSIFRDDSDDDDDIFGSVPEQSIPNVKKQIKEPLKPEHGAVKKEGANKNLSKSLFNDSDSDTDLFSTKPKKIETKTNVESKVVSKKPSLFGDNSDTEDELFTNIPKKTIDFTKQPPTKSLFGDDEDVDIFQTTARTTTQQNVSAAHNVTKTNTIQKTSSQVTTLDPLSSFLNDT